MAAFRQSSKWQHAVTAQPINELPGNAEYACRFRWCDLLNGSEDHDGLAIRDVHNSAKHVAKGPVEFTPLVVGAQPYRHATDGPVVRAL